MQIQSHDTARRYGIALAGLALALVLTIGIAAAAATALITVDDPDNETVAVDVTVENVGNTSITDATITATLETTGGTVAATKSTTVTAPTNTSFTFAMDALSGSGDNTVHAIDLTVWLEYLKKSEEFRETIEQYIDSTTVTGGGTSSSDDSLLAFLPDLPIVPSAVPGNKLIEWALVALVGAEIYGAATN